MNRPEDVVIVLAEDDPAHARLIEKNLRLTVANPLVRFGNGKEALDYLRSEERWTKQHLLLLDLNMPVMDGYQVLQQLKEDPRTKLIPVVVLTTTDDPGEIQRCYDLGCNAYVVKAADYDRFTEAMRHLGMFLSITRMPRSNPSALYHLGLTVSKPTSWPPPAKGKGEPGGLPG